MCNHYITKINRKCKLKPIHLSEYCKRHSPLVTDNTDNTLYNAEIIAKNLLNKQTELKQQLLDKQEQIVNLNTKSTRDKQSITDLKHTIHQTRTKNAQLERIIEEQANCIDILEIENAKNNALVDVLKNQVKDLEAKSIYSTTERVSDDVPYVIECGDEKFILSTFNDYKQLEEANVRLNKSIIKAGRSGTVKITCGCDDIKELEKQTETLRNQLNHSRHVLDETRQEARIRYKKMNTLYNESVENVVNLKKKVKQKNRTIAEMEQNTCKHNNINEANLSVLKQFQTLDNYILNILHKKTKCPRSQYHSHSIHDFCNLENVKSLLNEFEITPKRFKNIYSELKNKRINIAHPIVSNSVNDVLEVLNTLRLL